LIEPINKYWQKKEANKDIVERRGLALWLPH